MIINIPIQVDDTILEGKISKDVQDKVVQAVSDTITKALSEKGKSHARNYWNSKPEDGVLAIVSDIALNIVDEYKDAIIEETAKKLAMKLENRKAVKDLVKE